jgi:hypothetical protein
MGAEVTMRLYAGMGHTVNQDEIDFGRALLDAVAGQLSTGQKSPE